MNISIECYGKLKNQFSDQVIALEINRENACVTDAFELLCKQFNTPFKTAGIKPIINDTFADWQDVIKDNDVVGFFPPASGG